MALLSQESKILLRVPDMRYRNIKTGQIVDVHSKLGGKNWVSIDGDKVPKKETAAVKPAPIAEEEVIPAKKTTKKTTTKAKTKK